MVLSRARGSSVREVGYIERRLHPSRSLPEYFTLRHLLEKVTEIVSVLEKSGWATPIRVLDAGAGCAPYRSLFASERFQYFGADSETISGISVVADGQRLPFPDASFDLVLSNQVLEHVADPRKVADELKRLVSVRGYLLLSCPFVWEIHNYPGDFWRFTAQALELLFAEMDLVYLEPSSNSAECLAQTFNLFLNRNLKSKKLKTSLFRLLNSEWLAARMPKGDRLLPTNYVLVARNQIPVSSQSRTGGNRRELAPPTGNFRKQLDTPASVVRAGAASLQICGWIAGEARMDRVSARIDGSQEWPLRCNLPRLDVWRTFPEYRNAHRCGFAGECPVVPLTAGEHWLQILATCQGTAVPWEPIRFLAV